MTEADLRVYPNVVSGLKGTLPLDRRHWLWAPCSSKLLSLEVLLGLVGLPLLLWHVADPPIPRCIPTVMSMVYDSSAWAHLRHQCSRLRFGFETQFKRRHFSERNRVEHYNGLFSSKKMVQIPKDSWLKIYALGLYLIGSSLSLVCTVCLTMRCADDFVKLRDCPHLHG